MWSIDSVINSKVILQCEAKLNYFSCSSVEAWNCRAHSGLNSTMILNSVVSILSPRCLISDILSPDISVHTEA